MIIYIKLTYVQKIYTYTFHINIFPVRTNPLLKLLRPYWRTSLMPAQHLGPWRRTTHFFLFSKSSKLRNGRKSNFESWILFQIKMQVFVIYWMYQTDQSVYWNDQTWFEKVPNQSKLLISVANHSHENQMHRKNCHPQTFEQWNLGGVTQGFVRIHRGGQWRMPSFRRAALRQRPAGKI